MGVSDKKKKKKTVSVMVVITTLAAISSTVVIIVMTNPWCDALRFAIQLSENPKRSSTELVTIRQIRCHCKELRGCLMHG